MVQQNARCIWKEGFIALLVWERQTLRYMYVQVIHYWYVFLNSYFWNKSFFYCSVYQLLCSSFTCILSVLCQQIGKTNKYWGFDSSYGINIGSGHDKLHLQLVCYRRSAAIVSIWYPCLGIPVAKCNGKSISKNISLIKKCGTRPPLILNMGVTLNKYIICFGLIEKRCHFTG